MDRLNSYIVRVGSLELGTVLFWMFFWLANGLAKIIAGTHIGVRFAKRGDVNPFEVTLDKMGWGTALGDFAYIFTGIVELIVGLIFTWALIQFFMRTGPAAQDGPGFSLGCSLAASSSLCSHFQTWSRRPARLRSSGTPPTSA